MGVHPHGITNMSEQLKKVYQNANALDRYYEERTPIDLLRAKKIGSHGDLMQPTLIGWNSQRGPRHPDVLVKNQKDESPQYLDAGLSQLAIETKELELTTEILRNADKYVVRGCRTMKGNHRGISVFDKQNAVLRGFDWYLIPANTELPAALAVTRDEPALSKPTPIHYTVAPKDDMPLSLFLQYLKSVGDQSKLVKA